MSKPIFLIILAPIFLGALLAGGPAGAAEGLTDWPARPRLRTTWCLGARRPGTLKINC